MLIWDRPNCGEADISFAGESESVMCADALAALLKALDFGPTLLVGGSGGSRQSLITAARHADVVKAMFLFWLSGGPIGMMGVAMHYCGEAGIAATRGGMEAVAELRMFKEPIERNPGNRDRILSQEPKAFIARMQAWANGFSLRDGSPIPGMEADQFRSLTMPTMILRSGSTDIHHPRETSEEVHRLIPGSHLAEPPWGDNEWNERQVAAAQSGVGLFSRWPLLAPQIIAFFSTFE